MLCSDGSIAAAVWANLSSRRSGAIERELIGLTPKVQNYYFRRMLELGILERVVYPEVSPHVEYHLTDFGQRFIPILDAIEELQQEMKNDY